MIEQAAKQIDIERFSAHDTPDIYQAKCNVVYLHVFDSYTRTGTRTRLSGRGLRGIHSTSGRKKLIRIISAKSWKNPSYLDPAVAGYLTECAY